VPELVTTTGSALLGGFTLFQVLSRIPTPLEAWSSDPHKVQVARARGLWSLPVRTAVEVNGVPYDRPANPYHAENDFLIFGTECHYPVAGLLTSAYVSLI
jgi:cleavage and polyadenylation specificity factor subunit 1